MILFLDVVSPRPKFVLIDKDQIIRSIHILDKNIFKISDSLLPKYLMLEKKYGQITHSAPAVDFKLEI